MKNNYDYKILSSLFNYIGNNPYIEANFYAELGFNISFGNNSFLNHDVTIIDYAPVKIENDVNIAPTVTIDTSIYPTDVSMRKNNQIFCAPIIIRNNVWIGAHAVITAGITIGENSIIGAGSVVINNIPKNVVAVGNPAKIIRNINLTDIPDK